MHIDVPGKSEHSGRYASFFKRTSRSVGSVPALDSPVVTAALSDSCQFSMVGMLDKIRHQEVYQQTNRVKKRMPVGGHDGRRGQLSYARRRALGDLFVAGPLRHAQRI